MVRLKDRGVVAWLYMMRITDKLHRLEGEHLTGYDLTPAQFGVLAHLVANEGISQQALSQRLFVTKGNVCGLIGRLEERGLVVRHSDPEDKRINLLHLTPKGRELAERVVPAHEQFISEYMSTLSFQEQGKLRSLLRRLDKSIADDAALIP